MSETLAWLLPPAVVLVAMAALSLIPTLRERQSTRDLIAGCAGAVVVLAGDGPPAAKSALVAGPFILRFEQAQSNALIDRLSTRADRRRSRAMTALLLFLIGVGMAIALSAFVVGVLLLVVNLIR